MSKEILFSVTAKDCRWDTFRGTGKGGQKRNKTESGVRCTHLASGAVGQSDDSRSQHDNRRTAFKRMAATATFKAWHRREVGKHLGEEQIIQDAVERAMQPQNLEIEYFNPNE